MLLRPEDGRAGTLEFVDYVGVNLVRIFERWIPGGIVFAERLASVSGVIPTKLKPRQHIFPQVILNRLR